jgi:hypothetical protein
VRHGDSDTSIDGPRKQSVPYSFRLPKPGAVDPYFGAARTFWNQRILATRENGFRPPIRSISDRKKGAVRGVRFIIFESALAYFRQLEAQQNAPESGRSDPCELQPETKLDRGAV